MMDSSDLALGIMTRDSENKFENEKSNSKDNGPLLAQNNSYLYQAIKDLLKFIGKNKIRIMFEASVIIVVFSVALWYFRNKVHTSSLVLEAENSGCDQYTPVYTLNSQSYNSYQYYDVSIPSDPNNPNGEMNHTTLTLVSYWKSCAMSAVTSTPMVLSNELNQNYSKVSFNATSSSMTLSEVIEANMTANDAQAIITANAYFYADTPDDVPFVDTQPIISTPDCFQLFCFVNSIPGKEDEDNYHIPIMGINGAFKPSGTITASMMQSESSVTSSCTVAIYGTPITYFTTSNSLTLSESGQCVRYYSLLNAIGLALPFTLTAYSIMNIFFHFAEISQKH